MSRALIAVVLAFPLITLANPHYHPDVEVNVPPEVFSSGGQSAQPCTQCCVYQDQNYSEGAVIKAEGILLQCQRDDKTLSTNPAGLAAREAINASNNGMSAGASGYRSASSGEHQTSA